MRQLTTKQKIILTDYIHDYPECNSYEDLPSDIWDTLVKINDTEILWQEVNRFLSDAYFKNLYQRN